MRKPSPRRLKVFEARLGFYDTVVAAPSQAAALRAWGVHRNLFADGEARATSEAAAVTAAIARPGTPLKRPVGSAGAFEVEPTGLPKVPAGSGRRTKPPTSARAKAKAPAAPPSPPSADRAPLTEAEAVLQALDESRRAEEAMLRRRQTDLDAEKSAAQAAYAQARKAATAALAEARAAYRKAGGRD